MKNFMPFFGFVFFLLVLYKTFGPTLYQAGGGPFHDAKVAAVKAMQQHEDPHSYLEIYLESHSLQKIRDKFTVEFARYDFEYLRAGAVAGSVCGTAKVSNTEGKVIRSDQFYYDGHEAHLNYGYRVEVCDLAALRHGVERNGIAGPCSQVLKKQEPSLLSTLDVDALKTLHDDPPVRFIFDPNRPRAKPSDANPLAGKTLSDTIRHDCFAEPPVASSPPDTTFDPPASDRRAE
jgi:hypothetical protein